jgi:hypothetical protein
VTERLKVAVSKTGFCPSGGARRRFSRRETSWLVLSRSAVWTPKHYAGTTLDSGLKGRAKIEQSEGEVKGHGQKPV